MKKLIIALAVLSLATACGSDDDVDHGPTQRETSTVDLRQDPSFSFQIVDTPNGEIECIYASRYADDGGPSCNWEKFNKSEEDE